MAYNGYLIKTGSTTIPFRYIKFDSYSITPNSRLDLDSYRNANGVLIREVLEHTATQVVFATPPMDLADMQAFVSLLKTNFTSDIERKCALTYYDMENDVYATGNFYMPDIKWSIYHANSSNIKYNPTEVSFIEY